MTIIASASGVQFSAWYDYVLPDVPGLTPGAAAQQAIREAGIEYARLARMMESDAVPINVVAGQGDYAIVTTDGSIVIEPKLVTLDGKELTPASEGDIEAELGTGWRSMVDTPTFFYCKEEGGITLAAKPAASSIGGLLVTAYVTPAASATTLPPRMFNVQDHRYAVASGAKASLLASQNKPYTNPELARVFRAMFEDYVGSTQANRAKGNTGKPMRVPNRNGL